MESLQIIDKFCSGPLVLYIFMQVIRNAKQSFADVLQNRCSLNICKFHRKTPILEFLCFNKVAGLKAWNFIKKRCFPTEVFSCKICEIFKDTFFYRTPPVAASGNGKTFHPLSIFITMI